MSAAWGRSDNGFGPALQAQQWRTHAGSGHVCARRVGPGAPLYCEPALICSGLRALYKFR